MTITLTFFGSTAMPSVETICTKYYGLGKSTPLLADVQDIITKYLENNGKMFTMFCHSPIENEYIIQIDNQEFVQVWSENKLAYVS